MKPLFLLLLSVFSGAAYAQFDKSVSLVASMNFDFRTRGIGMNDAGLGANINALFFARGRLQLLTETSVDAFIGSKLYAYPDEGRLNKTPLIYTAKAGPQFFVFKNLAISATAGPAIYSVESTGFSSDLAFKFAITGFPGRKRRIAISAFKSMIANDDINIKYIGFQLGYRFY